MFLTAGSFTKFTSVNTVLTTPSSINTAYPVTGQPPSFYGPVHVIVISVLVEVTLVGAEN